MVAVNPLSELPVRKHKYGWRQSLPDRRDLRRTLPQYGLASLSFPPVASLQSAMPPIYDQGSIGSCTANSTCAAVEYNMMRQGLPFFGPSRLFVYYNTRVIEGTVDSDAGAEVRNAIKAAATLGACPEVEWPYDETKFTIQPPPTAYTDAKLDVVTKYEALGEDSGITLDDIHATISGGQPIVFGMSCYESFEGDAIAQTGIMSMPAPNEKMVGGHCILAVGYDDNKRMVKVRNSWGTGWGDQGYFEMPYDFFLGDDCSDFWVVESVASTA